MPDVGIVMPVYKQIPIYLQRAIRSIRRQTYKNFHLIIVIDGTTPEVKRTVRKAMGKDRRIKVITRRHNQGIATALNIGFRSLFNRTDINYVTWVSSDNIYYPNFLSVLRQNLIQSPPNIGLVYSCFRHVNSRGKAIFGQAYRRETCAWQNQPKNNILEVCFIGASFMYKKHFAMKTGNYRLEPIEDYDYWLRITELCDIKYIPRTLMDYRVNSPRSVSAQLQSKEEHRRWRYSYQLAKYEARQRRKIPFETTVVYPVNIASEQTINMLESLYEQSYSNYKLLVIDISPTQAVTPMIKSISDPRVAVLQMPSVSVKKAICEGAKRAGTPYTIAYGNRAMPSFALQNMVNQIRTAPPTVISTFTNAAGTALQARIIHPPNEPIFSELYRTRRLLNIVEDG
jgi:glycosyltransferase involved in cell wall biosynthesis